MTPPPNPLNYSPLQAPDNIGRNAQQNVFKQKCFSELVKKQSTTIHDARAFHIIRMVELYMAIEAVASLKNINFPLIE